MTYCTRRLLLSSMPDQSWFDFILNQARFIFGRGKTLFFINCSLLKSTIIIKHFILSDDKSKSLNWAESWKRDPKSFKKRHMFVTSMFFDTSVASKKIRFLFFGEKINEYDKLLKVLLVLKHYGWMSVSQVTWEQGRNNGHERILWGFEHSQSLG